MRTTHSSLSELDGRKWKREVLEFCRDYQFLGGVDIIEQQSTGPYTTRLLFRYGKRPLTKQRELDQEERQSNVDGSATKYAAVPSANVKNANLIELSNSSSANGEGLEF